MYCLCVQSCVCVCVCVCVCMWCLQARDSYHFSALAVTYYTRISPLFSKLVLNASRLQYTKHFLSSRSTNMRNRKLKKAKSDERLVCMIVVMMSWKRLRRQLLQDVWMWWCVGYGREMLVELWFARDFAMHKDSLVHLHAALLYQHRWHTYWQYSNGETCKGICAGPCSTCRCTDLHGVRVGVLFVQKHFG